jgi:hypothetical protein
MGKKKQPLEYYKKRFFSLLKQEDECLIFIGSRNYKGYGRMHNRNEQFMHRFSWFIHNGPIPKGMHVLHHCDNPPCCNPKHLWIGTNKDNSDDKFRKNRFRIVSGENHPSSKISEEQAQKVAAMITDGKTSHEISLELGIARHNIYGIKSKKIWKHLEFTIPEKKEFWLKKNCLICEKEFKRRRYEYSKSKYCSRECLWKSLIKNK